MSLDDVRCVLGGLFSRTIVARLRLAFLSFVLASVAIFFLIWKQMDQLSVVESFIFDSALPSLELDQEFDRHITNVTLYASTMVSDIPQDEVDRLYTKLKTENDRIIEILKNEHGIGIRPSSTSDIGAIIEGMNSRTDELFRVVSEGSFLKGENSWYLNRLEKMKSKFTLISEVEYLKMWDELLSAASTPDIDRNKLIENVSSVATFIEVEAHILELFVLVESLSELVTEKDVRIAQSRIDFIYQKAAQSILTRPQINGLIYLSKMLDDLKSITHGPSGLIKNTLQLIDLRSQRSDLSKSVLKSVTDISRIQRESIAGTESAMNDIGALLRTTVSQTIIICLFGIVFILTPTLAASSFILKRQIGDRMARLTKTAERIAEGEIEVTVDTSGNDEISTIAHALNGFKRSARELLRSNADLERFAYVASHDLRSPIQAVHNLATWTIEDADRSLSKEARENLELIISRTERMRQLTGDLLLYAQLNTTENDIAAFSCRRLVEEAIGLICADEGYIFDLKIESDRVSAPLTPIRLILGNLIGNAVKHHDQNSGHIEILVWVSGGHLMMTVKDDGPGIPSNHQDEIFEPFKRLQSQDEVPGSGMGLAIITRIVQTFGGSISLQSEPEIRRGAEFTVSIPLPEQDVHADHIRKSA